MLQKFESTREQWQEVNAMLERWLAERQELLVRFCAVSGVRPLSENVGRYGSEFQRFCEILVDYVSAGHFEIYEQLIQEAAVFDDGSVELAREFYPIIENTTEAVLAFNDRCAEGMDMNQLGKELSCLGEALEARFDAEDRLIELLHVAHKDVA